MVSIYCIEDINGLKYVGSTIQKLKRRLQKHNTKKNGTSSKKLNLNNCIIYELERCKDKDRIEREKYWINNIDCVNEKKYESLSSSEYHHKYRKSDDEYKKQRKEYNYFRKKNIVNGCYDFIKLLEQY